MNSEKFKKIEEIYHAVLAIPPTERDSFLEQSCGGDEELRDEIESLLAFDSNESKISISLESLATEIFAEPESPSLIGEKLGHYEILALLGKGGMGEVYLAQDSKLNRKVALKILRQQLIADGKRTNRFIREAQAASALNHPNIVTIHEIGEANGTHFIVTEFIEGKTLREVMKTETLSIEQIIKIVLQIAAGIETAHNAGFIHRDIKPENIMLRSDGLIKILDFGLAKLATPQPLTEFESIHTQKGVIMGTAAYMSPEQARGKEVDSRTDIWSLGVVLYEMLSGNQPFGGETPSDTIAAILKNEPNLLVEKTPAPLSKIIKRALEKEPDSRYQKFADFHNDLNSLLVEFKTDPNRFAVTGQAHSPTDDYSLPIKSNVKTSSSSKNLLFGIVSSILLGGLILGVYWKYFSGSNSPINSFQSIRIDPLTANGVAVSTAISRDGKYIAYAKDEGGKQSLWLRQTAIAGDTQIVQPTLMRYNFLDFSPDGNFLYFVGVESDGQPSSLYQITTLGRNQRKIISGVDSKFSFSPDGKQIAFKRASGGENSIIIADVEGGNERVLRTRNFPEVYTDAVSWSPNGKLIAVPTLTRGVSYAGGIAVIEVASGKEIPIVLLTEKVLRISRVEWMNDGKGLIFTQYTGMMGQRYQLRYVAYPSGEVQNVSNDLTSYEDLSLTADSKTLVSVQREYSMGIWLTPENDFSQATQIETRTGKDDGERGLSWTKDGKIVYVSTEGEAQNIWRMDADGGNPKPLTTGYDGGKMLPTLAIGGDQIIFLGEAHPGMNFFSMNSDGQNLKTVAKDNDFAFEEGSANENWIVFTTRGGGKNHIWKMPLKGGEAVKLTEAEATNPVISPDGKMVAYFIREKGQKLQLGVISVDGGTPLKTFELPITTVIDAGISWNKNGDGILYVNTLGTTSNIWNQPLNGTKTTSLTNFKEFQIAQFALSADSKRLAIARGSRNRDIVLIKSIGN